MKQIKTALRRIGLLLALGAGLNAAGQTTLQNRQGTVRAQLDSAGRLTALELYASKSQPVGFRTDAFAGPALTAGGQPLALKPQGEARFAGANDSLQYSLAYRIDGQGLQLAVTCRALRALDQLQFSLRLGLDTEMDHYPQWRQVFFPTMLRCERTHFWGYFMSPLGRIVAVSSPDPVASYHLHYNNDKRLHSFAHGHRIRTASLDLVNPAPLPARHPRLNGLEAGETRSWRIYLDALPALEALPALVTARTHAAVAQAGLYTLAPGEATRLTFTAPARPRLTLKAPDGSSRRLKARPDGKGRYAATFSPPDARHVHADGRMRRQALRDDPCLPSRPLLRLSEGCPHGLPALSAESHVERGELVRLLLRLQGPRALPRRAGRHGGRQPVPYRLPPDV